MALLMVTAGSIANAATITVNTISTEREPNEEISLTEAILLANGVRSASARLTEAEQALVDGTVGNQDTIVFQIPGDGPHLIAVPDSGFAKLTRAGITVDGYSQPGASPNTASIREPNNAVLQIAIDGRSGNRNSEGDLLTLSGDNITVKGLSFLNVIGPEQYGVNFRDDATGGQVSGCWIGLHPDGETIAGGEIGIGVCCGTGGGHVIGTNGDGIDDRAEFNVIVGHNVNTIVEEAPDVRISGNFIGVLPSGLEAADSAELTEGDAVEGAFLPGLVIGTNGDGTADADEGNIIGGMLDDVIEFWDGENPGVIIAGNVIGVGIDGETPLPNLDFMRTPRISAQIGSNLDGISDEVEANIIAYHETSLIEYTTDQVFVALRGNRMFENLDPLYGQVESSFHGTEVTDPNLNLFPDLDANTNAERLVGSVPLSDTSGLSPATIDLYLADAGTAGFAPQGALYLGSFTDNSEADRDDRKRFFDFDLSAVPYPFTGPGQFVIASFVADTIEPTRFGTTDFSNAVEVMLTETAAPPTATPEIDLTRQADGTLVLTYAGRLETASDISGPWTPVEAASPLNLTPDQGAAFYRVLP